MAVCNWLVVEAALVARVDGAAVGVADFGDGDAVALFADCGFATRPDGLALEGVLPTDAWRDALLPTCDGAALAVFLDAPTTGATGPEFNDETMAPTVLALVSSPELAPDGVAAAAEM